MAIHVTITLLSNVFYFVYELDQPRVYRYLCWYKSQYACSELGVLYNDHCMITLLWSDLLPVLYNSQVQCYITTDT